MRKLVLKECESTNVLKNGSRAKSASCTQKLEQWKTHRNNDHLGKHINLSW